MLRKNYIFLVGFLIFLGTFSGCAGLQKEPVKKNYFGLDTAGPIFNQQDISSIDNLLVKEFFINPLFDSHSFVYRLGETEYITDYYNEFITYPAKLVTEKIAETLYASGYFTPALTNMKQDIRYRISGKITRLYGDFQKTDDPKAVIEIRIILEKRTDKDFQAISSKTYLAEEPISSRKPDHLVTGWNTGLSKIIAQFIRDFKPPAS